MDPAQAPISSSSMMETEKDVQKQLTILRRQYFQLVEPPQLRWPVDSVLKVSSVQSWMYRHFFDAASVPVLPPSRYRLRVLKSLISKLEGAIEDPEEDVGLSFFLLPSKIRRLRSSLRSDRSGWRLLACLI